MLGLQSNEAGIFATALLGGPSLVWGWSVAKAAVKKRNGTKKRPRVDCDLERLARVQVDGLKDIVARLDAAKVPPGGLPDRVQYVIDQVAGLKEHEAALRNEIVAHLPSGADGMGLASAVRCVVDFYATLRDEAGKVIPAVVTAVERPLWRVWARALGIREAP